jgi:hypothetical protein
VGVVGGPASTRLEGAILRFIARRENELPAASGWVGKRRPEKALAEARLYAEKGVDPA